MIFDDVKMIGCHFETYWLILLIDELDLYLCKANFCCKISSLQV